MTYSIDLKERVVAFVREGGSKAEATRRYKVSRKAKEKSAWDMDKTTTVRQLIEEIQLGRRFWI